MKTPTRNTQCGKILARLKRSRGGWVPMVELYLASGSMNIHTRIDELRREYGYPIPPARIERNGMKQRSYYKIQ